MFGTMFSSTYLNLETGGVYPDADDDADDNDDGDDDETCQGEPQFQFDPNQLQHQPDWDHFEHDDKMMILGDDFDE